MADIFFLILIVIIIYQDVVFEGKKLSNSSTNLAKGIGSLLIFAHHLSSRIDKGVLSQMNYPAVAVFFCVAGYCCSYGMYSKNNYNVKILILKVPKLFLSCIFTLVISYIFYTILDGQVSAIEVVKSLKGNRLWNWYFSCIILLYITFAITSSCIKSKKKLITVTFVYTIVYMIIFRILGLNGSWYCSVLAFPIGNLIEYKREALSILLRKHRRKLALLLGIVFLLLYSLIFIFDSSKNSYRIIRLLCQIIAAMVFAIFVISFSFDYKAKRILSIIGINSAEIL